LTVRYDFYRADDIDVLNSAKLLSKGGIWEKIRAFDILIKNYWTSARNECEKILINQAKINQPIDVRFHVALGLKGYK
jgi:hypothetical protein